MQPNNATVEGHSDEALAMMSKLVLKLDFKARMREEERQIPH